MDEYLEEDKAMSKYFNDLDRYHDIILGVIEQNNYIHEDQIENIISVFEYYNQPDVYALSMHCHKSFTTVRIFNKHTELTIISSTDSFLTDALIMTVGKFIEYLSQQQTSFNTNQYNPI